MTKYGWNNIFKNGKIDNLLYLQNKGKIMKIYKTL